jgi:hypothetical protein
LGIVVNSSCETTRPLLRLLGLIASVVVYAHLWSGDQRIQQEIAQNRAMHRPVYAGPSVLQHLPVSPQVSITPLAQLSPSSALGFLDRIPGGHYQVADDQGNIASLVLQSRRGGLPIGQSLTIQSSHGTLRFTPMQSVSASSLIYR